MGLKRPGELMSFLGFLCSSVFVRKKAEMLLLMGPLSTHGLDVVQTWYWWLGPAHVHSLRPPGVQASSGP